MQQLELNVVNSKNKDNTQAIKIFEVVKKIVDHLPMKEPKKVQIKKLINGANKIRSIIFLIKLKWKRIKYKKKAIV